MAKPLDVKHWLRILEQKFLLLTITDEQRVRFAAQQLLDSASAWWDTFNAMQPVDHRVTWQKFTTAFREYYIPAGVLNKKLIEFLDLRQGCMFVMDYINKFNHLSQYAGTHVDTDEKKRDRFYRSLSCILQELYTGNYQTFGAMMNTAIAIEGLQRDSQAELKRKRVAIGSSSHPRRRSTGLVLPVAAHADASTDLTSITMLKKCLRVSDEAVEIEGLPVQPDLMYIEHPIKILDEKERVTRNNVVKFYKVQWQNHSENEATWQQESYILKHYPDLLSGSPR
ncbi:uncharacterized protein [Miscanthus floridulus]|uniref:uncharacterized protein n=1 Tax=Miscanthus floridulus TaxID=154761 RepID=UPI003458C708